MSNYHEVKRSVFFFFCLCFGVICKKLLSNPRSYRFTPKFPSKSFMSLALIFRYWFSFSYFLYMLQGEGPTYVDF